MPITVIVLLRGAHSGPDMELHVPDGLTVAEAQRDGARRAAEALGTELHTAPGLVPLAYADLIVTIPAALGTPARGFYTKAPRPDLEA